MEAKKVDGDKENRIRIVIPTNDGINIFQGMLGRAKEIFIYETKKERGTRTEHIATLDDEYYQHLTDGEMTQEELIEMSFEFLLEREPKESIFSKFNLKIINNYFPEFEKEMRRCK